MAKEKKSAKEEMAKAKEDLGKIKSEWKGLPKSGKIGTIVLGAIIVIAIFALVSGDGESASTVNTTNSNADSSESVSEETAKNIPIDEYMVENNNHVDEAMLSDDGILTIHLSASSSLSPKSVASTHVYWSFEAVNEAFKDDSVKEVNVSIEALLIDNKGNEDYESVVTYAYTREDFDELNYENFLRLAGGNEWRILNESYAYFIHPAIFNEIDDDYQNNLSNGKSKVPLVEE